MESVLDDALAYTIIFFMNFSSRKWWKYYVKNGFRHFTAAKIMGYKGFFIFCSIKS
jgi:hypothetical protein